MAKYFFHFRCSTYPLVVNELCSNNKENYGQFEYVILQEGDLTTAYCSDLGVRQQYNYGKKNLFDESKRRSIFKRIDKLDIKLKKFSFKKNIKVGDLESRRKKWLIFYKQAREIFSDFGKVYFVMEVMTLAPLAEFVEKICERDGLLQDQVLHNISLANNFSKKEKKLVEALKDLGRKKLLLHADMEPVMLLLYKLYEFMAEAAKISLKEAIMMNDRGIIEFLETGTLDKKITKKRAAGMALIIGQKDAIFRMSDSSEYKRWKNILESKFDGEIKGTVACRGKVRGKVSLHLSWIFTKEIPAGNILVAGMTNPLMIPFIKNAGAIVTDEGGLTCHAAIISREMNIPCIVGTKVATRVLKDGDLVEVDANRGVVRIIKRK